MNSQILDQSANAWVQQAKQDIANKIREFLNESGISLPQMANDLGIDINELNNILNGGIPSMMTFAKLMIASGMVIEIKPIEEANIPMDENGMPIPQGPMPAGMPMPGMHQRPMQRPSHSMFDDFQRQPAPEPAPVQHQPRGANGRFKPWPKPQGGAPVPPPPGMRPAPMFGGMPKPGNRPPFAQMTREELVQVVREHLWQNEIDLAHVDRDQLVRFLEDKDRQFAELRNEAVGIDPAVAQLKTKLKNVIDKNPHLVNYLKDIFEQ
jgi:hypothetical protein